MSLDPVSMHLRVSPEHCVFGLALPTEFLILKQFLQSVSISTARGDCGFSVPEL